MNPAAQRRAAGYRGPQTAPEPQDEAAKRLDAAEAAMRQQEAKRYLAAKSKAAQRFPACGRWRIYH